MRKHYYFLILFISVFTVQASALSDCLPLNITGNFSICLPGQNTTQLTGSGGSGFPNPTTPWISSNLNVATVDNTGLVTSVGFGSTTITYTDSAGTQVSQNVYVSSYPTISGNTSACPGGNIQLSGSLFPHPITPWQSSNTAIATVDNNGLVTGVSAGTCTITYMNIGGCTTNQTVTIKPLLSPTVSCGTWANNAMSFNWNAVLGATNYSVVYNINGGGYVFGASGNILTYTVSNVQPTDQVVLYVAPAGAVGTCFSGAFSCQSTPCPEAVTLSGNQNICLGNTTSFTSTVPGGTWSSSNTAIASVNPATGVITGNAAGTATMMYTVLGTGGCPNVVATRTVVVNTPASAGILSGNQAICYDDENVFFSSTVAGGTWSSSNPSVATINANSGLITPVGTYGTTTMTYTVLGLGGCSNASATRTLTLKEPSLSLVSGSTQTTTCIHTPMIPIVFNGIYATSASVTDLPAGVTYSYSSGILTISGTPTVAGVYEFQMFASGDCASAMT
ncbi:MAG: Ig-like domain-containing protein, partial [Flavobacteriaceae bacterium]